ncbi:hypothetical protein DN33_3283 [Vibrio cholerae]|nr:hypothetical protein DN33_3283 [Vibrio cholerae]
MLLKNRSFAPVQWSLQQALHLGIRSSTVPASPCNRCYRLTWYSKESAVETQGIAAVLIPLTPPSGHESVYCRLKFRSEYLLLLTAPQSSGL